MSSSGLFTPIQRRSLLLAINRLSQSIPPKEIAHSMRTVTKLCATRDRITILDYHSHEDYITHLEDFHERESGLSHLFVQLWEPYRKQFKKKIQRTALEQLRHLRNRFSHTLSAKPENAEGFLIELSRVTWTTIQWAEFVLECIKEMNNDIPVNEEVIFRNAEDLLLAASQERQKLEHHRTDLQSTIEFLTSDDEWSQYVGVLDQRGNVAIDRLIELLDPEKAKYVVQICGEGGLGKTALMREYIRRNINDGSSTNLYENYLLLSSKATAQGEVNTLPSEEIGFQTTDPKYPFQGPIRFTEGLTFLEFKRIIAAHAFEDSTEMPVIHRAIHENRFLIVLDNFEDCSDEDREQYIDLFDSLRAGCRSRIIITGRKEASADDIPTIRLNYLNSKAASRLLIARYLYLQDKHSSQGIWEFRNSIYNALNDLRQVDFIDSLNKSMMIEKDEGSDQLDPAVFRDRIGHPLVILRLAVEMGRPNLPMMYDSEPDYEVRLIKILTHIAKDNNFKSWQQEVSKWVTDKAYEDIASHPECVLILFRLLEGTATLGELKEHVNSEHGAVEKVPEAIRRLESHQILIRLRSDGRYEAAEQTKSHIRRSTEIEENEAQETTKVADEIESTLDGILTNMVNNGEPSIRHELIIQLLSTETPLDRRKSITNHSYILIENILNHLSFEATDIEIQLTQSFAELASNRLAKENTTADIQRKTMAEILMRSLCSFRADAPTIHRLTRTIGMDDISQTNQNTKTLFSRLILRSIQQIPDLYPIYLADMLSILAATGGDANILISDMKNAWTRIISHPNVQHSEFEHTVQSKARKLLYKMAQNDEVWRKETANLLNQYQAENEPQHWDDVQNWYRYALPPHAPPEDMMKKLVIPDSFSPGDNGLSFDHFINGIAVFQVVENPILNEADVAEENIVIDAWPPEDCAMFEMNVTSWFGDKIAERPNGFAATDLTNFIHQNYGRTKEVIPKASHGKFLGWMPWFEEIVLSNPKFQSYYLDRPTGKHVVITRKNTTENPQHWLFDDTSSTAPNLPQPLDMAEILIPLSRGKKVAHNLHQIHDKFLVGYLNYLEEENIEPSELSLRDLIKTLRTYIDRRMILAKFSNQMQQGIKEEINLWLLKVMSIGESRKARNHKIQPIRGRKATLQEEE